MPKSWLDNLDSEKRAIAQKMIEQMKELGGATNPELWVRSEIEENIPQMARFLILRKLWKEIDSWRDDVAFWVERNINEAEKRPQHPLAKAGFSLKKVKDLGVSLDDLGNIAEMVAFESIFYAVSTIDEGYESDEDNESLPCWHLIETNANDEPTGRFIDGLHESLLDR
jgi:hypothetical protein